MPVVVMFIAGTTATTSGETTLRAGSLLDDNQWHDVDITRKGREIYFTVDRLTVTNMTNGDFYQLDLDRHIHLGGIYSFLQPGKTLFSRKNFTGCMENVWFDHMNILKDLRMNTERFEAHGAIMLGQCQVETAIPYSFSTLDSHLELDSEPGTRLRVGFDFRTYNKGGLLFMHNLSPGPGKVYVSSSFYRGYSPVVLSMLGDAD